MLADNFKVFQQENFNSTSTTQYRTERSVSSSTTIMRMLNVVLSKATSIRVGNCFHIPHILPQKRLTRQLVAKKWQRMKFMTISITYCRTSNDGLLPRTVISLPEESTVIQVNGKQLFK
ncbi:hypothetical protein CDAR_289161 [Caerostris darwini]|uniref:Uncharacterized protein n=1 Tax=Caerostris darwini TaxID=1538125 RepID=A0AAV4PI34_9ARAC|nr:hypothetical protein CDAR_289161 [Caerostris darwini]